MGKNFPTISLFDDWFMSVLSVGADDALDPMKWAKPLLHLLENHQYMFNQANAVHLSDEMVQLGKHHTTTTKK